MPIPNGWRINGGRSYYAINHPSLLGIYNSEELHGLYSSIGDIHVKRAFAECIEGVFRAGDRLYFLTPQRKKIPSDALCAYIEETVGISIIKRK